MTHQEAGQIVAILRAAYPGWKPTPETVRLWAEMFLDLDYSATSAAVRRILAEQEREFPPPIATIRKAVSVGSDPTLSLSPEEAWAEVLREVRRVGWCGTPRWSSPQVEAAVRAMGWREICMSEEGDSGTRAHFFRCFGAYQSRAVSSAVVPEDLRIGSAEETQRIGPPGLKSIEGGRMH